MTSYRALQLNITNTLSNVLTVYWLIVFGIGIDDQNVAYFSTSQHLLFRSDLGSQSNKGRSRYLTGQIRAGTLPSQIRPVLVR